MTAKTVKLVSEDYTNRNGKSTDKIRPFYRSENCYFRSDFASKGAPSETTDRKKTVKVVSEDCTNRGGKSNGEMHHFIAAKTVIFGLALLQKARHRRPLTANNCKTSRRGLEQSQEEIERGNAPFYKCHQPCS